MIKILCIVVLYKCNLYKSKSYRTFIKHNLEKGNVGLFIYDNSPIPAHSKDEFADCEIEYVSNITNPGVSKAYNEGSLYAIEKEYDWLIFLDQDTDFGDGDYFNFLVDSIKRYPKESLFVPLVRSYGGELMSPSVFGFRKKVDIVNGINTFRNFTFINSGICVSLPLFRAVGGYNERVFLDYSDHQFCERCRIRCNSFVALNYVLKQDYSDEICDLSRAKKRFETFCVGAINFETASLFTKFYIVFEVLKHTCSLTFKYKSSAFLKILVRVLV